jgi:hypothetical protein
MKKLIPLSIAVVAVLISGCTTSSQVQEMIDAAHRDYTEKSKAHDASLDVLRKSALASLEKSRQNGEMLTALQKKFEATLAEVKVFRGNSDAAKVMSAANTVKVANLEETVQDYRELVDETLAKLAEIDHLYEGAMIQHFQAVADSANTAVAVLLEGGVTSTNGNGSGLAEPIEIVAPDTSVPSN